MTDINKFIENCKTLKYKIKHIERAHRKYISSIEDMIRVINFDYQTQQQFGDISNNLQNILASSIQNQSMQHNQIDNMYKTVCRNIKVGGKKITTKKKSSTKKVNNSSSKKKTTRR